MSIKNKYKEVGDKEIIDKIINGGRRDLFGILYDRYSNKVYYKALGLTNDKNIAKDLTHDIMIKLFMNLSKFKGNSTFSLWVHSISYNHCIDYLRRRKKMSYTDFESDTLSEIKDDTSDFDFKVIKELKLERLEQLMETLPVDDKMILMMYYMDELPVKRVANLLQIGESAVKMRLMRARKRLAKLYHQENKAYGE